MGVGFVILWDPTLAGKTKARRGWGTRIFSIGWDKMVFSGKKFLMTISN